MGDLATPTSKKSVSVLDPGCGLAILSCALIEHIVEVSNLECIRLSLYETDSNVFLLTEQVLSYLQEWCLNKGVQLDHNLNKTDFVLEKYECLDEAPTASLCVPSQNNSAIIYRNLPKTVPMRGRRSPSARREKVQ